VEPLAGAARNQQERPFAVTAAWTSFELLLFGHRWGITITPYVPNVGLWTRIVLVLVSAAIAAQKFYALSPTPPARRL
jgi:hypothetical protein